MAALTHMVRLALRMRGIVIALACLLVAYGAYVLSRSSYDVFPEFAPPQVDISTEAPGLTAEQVEILVTQPIENAVRGAPGISSLRSQSLQGLSAITVKFDPKSDVYRIRQLVAERLTGVTGQLPNGVQPPVLTPLLSSTGDVVSIGLMSSTRSLMQLRTIADWTLRPHLLAVPGVANIVIYGGEVRQLQVQLDPERLIRYQLSTDEVLAAAQKATAIQGAGFIDTPNQRIVLQTEGQVVDPRLVARTVVRWRNGEAVTLGDLGHVVDAPAPRLNTALIMNQPGVIVKANLQYGANTLEVSRALDRALDGLHAPLEAQGVTLRTDLFRAANFIETATHNVRTSLLIGAVLVIAVLFLFLFDLRTAAISCTAIPLSLLAAVVLLEKLGYSLNTMTLGGLAIAIGEVVDDAVIDVENILRRMNENRHKAHPLPAFQVVLDASIEVRGAVVYATFAVVLVFIPIMTLTGLAGRMFAPLGAAYILAILASLAVALTVTPALCLMLLGRSDADAPGDANQTRQAQLKERESPLSRFLRNRYARLLQRVENHNRIVIVVVALLTLAGLALLPFLGRSFLPTLREGHFVLHMTMAPGSSIDASVRQGMRVTQALQAIPEVRLIAQQAGRASLDEVRGPEASEFDIDLRPGVDSTAADAHIRAGLDHLPGAAYELNSFFTERVNETLSGYTAPVAVSLFSNNLESLDTAAQSVSRFLGALPGATDVQQSAPRGGPQFGIRLRLPEVARYGLTPVEVLDDVRLAYEGVVAGQIHIGNESYDLNVILAPELRNRLDWIERLPIRNRAGQHLLLGQVAEVYETTGRSVIQHDGARRVQTVVCGVQGRSLGDFVAQAKRELRARVALPTDVLVEFSGAAEAQAQASSDLALHSAIAGIGIVMLLFIVLGHRNHVVLLLLNLPFALVGGLLAAGFQGEVSLGSLVGFVTVFGITLRNSIMLLTHYDHLVTVEGHTWGLDTAVTGAVERLVPILMTALVTALGLLPLALGQHAPGREIEGPMAWVIFGGLATSTALNLLVLPTLTLRFGRFATKVTSDK